MGVIAQAAMVQADIDVSGMGPAQKVRLPTQAASKIEELLPHRWKPLATVH